MPDFSILGTPNFAQAALGGYQAGAALGKQRQLDSALGAVDLSRPETILPVLRADPSTGATLLGASQTMAAAHAKAASQHALATAILASRGGGDPSSTASGTAPQAVPVLPPAGQTPGIAGEAVAASTGDPNDVVVTAPRPAPAPVQNAGWSDDDRAAIMADPQGFLDAQGGLEKLSKGHLENVKAQVDLEAQLLGSATDQASYTRALGMAKTAGIDVSSAPATYDPQWVAQMSQTTLTAKERLDHQLAVRSADRADASQAETMRHNRVDEGQGASRIGLEAANVGIARGHLAIAQHADARSAATAGAKTQGTAPVAHYEYRVVNGVTQRRLVK